VVAHPSGEGAGEEKDIIYIIQENKPAFKQQQVFNNLLQTSRPLFN
jgi:hypothetical protein